MSVPPRVRHYDRPLTGSMGGERPSYTRGRRGCAPPTPGLCKMHSYRGATAACRTILSDESDSARDTWYTLSPPRLTRCLIGRVGPVGRVGQHKRHLVFAKEVRPAYRSSRAATTCHRPIPPDNPAGDPDRGPFCIARVSRHEVPKTPGYLRYALYMRPR